MDWIYRTPYRLPAILGLYFIAHVVSRVVVSPTLGYDESEQAFLAQWLSWGYNNQPPLYTWLQRGLFELFGWSVLSMAILKNVLLWLTYLFVFLGVNKATGNLRIATLATVGMFGIPQIAWESHRDLSHTVAATCATAALFYSLVMLSTARSRSCQWRWYLITGLVVGTGIQCKYNFALVAIGFVLAMLTIERLRRVLLDWRTLVAVLVALVICLPNLCWILQHPTLASAKTISELSDGSPTNYWDSFATGSIALARTLVACSAISICAFGLLFVRPRDHSESAAADPIDRQMYRLLLERFLICIFVMLFLIVLTGEASEFKNRWVQPMICLLPAYLAIRYSERILRRPKSLQISIVATAGMMFAMIVGSTLRPYLGRFDGDYCRLNVPFAHAVEVIAGDARRQPQVILTPNMRVAGNLCMLYPDADVLSLDALHLSGHRSGEAAGCNARIWLFTDDSAHYKRNELSALAMQWVSDPSVPSDDWNSLEVPYLHGARGDMVRFHYCRLESRRLASRPAATHSSALKRRRD